MFALPAVAAQVFAWLLARIGPTGIVALGLIGFYEGLPLGPLRYLPLGVGHALESVVDGRVDRQRRAGETQERLAWQEAERRARAKADAELTARQAEIDQITIARTDDAARAAALERAIAAAKEPDNAQPAKPACPPRARVSRGVSERLDAAGRR